MIIISDLSLAMDLIENMKRVIWVFNNKLKPVNTYKSTNIIKWYLHKKKSFYLADHEERRYDGPDVEESGVMKRRHLGPTTAKVQTCSKIKQVFHNLRIANMIKQLFFILVLIVFLSQCSCYTKPLYQYVRLVE